MNRWSLIVALVCAVSLARSGSAQTPVRAGASNDSLRCVAVAPDTATGFVHGVIDPDAPNTWINRDRATRILRPLAAALASDTLTLLPVTKISEVDVTVKSRHAGRQARLLPKWAGHPALATEIAFTVEPSGALTDARILGRGDDATGNLLLRALATVASVAHDGSGRPARLRLRLSLVPDSARGMPLLAARQLTEHGTPPRVLEPTIAWPFATVGRNPTPATVVAWYAVNPFGKPVAGSLGAAPAGTTDTDQILRYREYVEAVKDAIGRMQHSPGEVGGCATTWRVVMLARFNVEAPPR